MSNELERIEEQLTSVLDEVKQARTTAKLRASADPTVPLNDGEYVIRFAYRAGKPNARNLPIAFTKKSWEQYVSRTESRPDTKMVVVTTTGQKVWVQRADCGAGCRCALEWEPV